ncbi:3-hydroxyacyl-ACP dehydratase FabZ [Brackiella oedipodis]|uniref:3-hydroxyacyl-ACP dehydratase FabZ n=1 Tax=Brackiella oedipodis TaxID=124225 RepID=UPI00048AE37E|nr:3-hydroxyacyl-ACP dehydratase FabZ [Brackiella oedipodis]
MTPIDIQGIMSRIPHRYPFLLVDRVLELEPEKSITAIKNVTINEPFFQGHFKHLPIMPGVLIIEALAQAGALFTMSIVNDGNVDFSQIGYYLVGIDEARFRKPVVPGDQLVLKVEAIKISRAICKYQATALVDDQEVASAKLMCAIRELK